MRYSFNVPIHAYLEKYVRQSFFHHQPGPYKIEEDSLLGKIVMSLLIDKRKHDVINKSKEMTSTIQLVLSEAMAERSPSIAKLVNINYFLDKHFKQALLLWVECMRAQGIRAYPATRLFLQHYNLDESEYSFETAIRFVHRDNQKKKTPHQRHNHTATASLHKNQQAKTTNFAS